MVIAEQFVVMKQSRGNDASNGKAPSNFADTLSVGSRAAGCHIKLSCKHSPLISFSAQDVQQCINRNHCYKWKLPNFAVEISTRYAGKKTKQK
jgi:hypothetical protein